MNKETREAIAKGKMVDFDVDEFMKDLRSDRVAELEAENAELRAGLIQVAQESVQRGVIAARMEVMAIRDSQKDLAREILKQLKTDIPVARSFNEYVWLIEDVEKVFAKHGIELEANNGTTK